jgi:hypothetical protein
MTSSNADSQSGRKSIDLQTALKGASWPAVKQDLLKTAKGNDADEDVMEALAALPDEPFDSVAAVSKAVGNDG